MIDGALFTRDFLLEGIGATAAWLTLALSDLVNAAYGLTPGEVALMWATAPPRMPLAPSRWTKPLSRGRYDLLDANSAASPYPAMLIPHPGQPI